MKKLRRQVWRVAVGIAGAAAIIVGIILTPLPGPGGLFVLGGLGILSTEFKFAQRWLAVIRKYSSAGRQWLAKRSWLTRNSIRLGVAVAITGMLFLVNTFGIIANLLDFDLPWAHSPLY